MSSKTDDLQGGPSQTGRFDGAINGGKAGKTRIRSFSDWRFESKDEVIYIYTTGLGTEAWIWFTHLIGRLLEIVQLVSWL